MEPEKTLVKKKKSKKPLIITLVVLAVLAAGAAAFYFLYWKNRTPEVVLTDAEFLIDVKSWEKEGAPTVIWTFKDEKNGELTTNKSNYYDFTWTLEKGDPGLLKVQTAWLLDLDDTFEFVLNREEKSFTVKNRTDNLESKFVPLGTAEAAKAAADAEKSAETAQPEVEKSEE